MTTGSTTRAAGRFADEAGDFASQFPVASRYWSDPEYRALLDAETQANRDQLNREWDERLRARRGAA